MLASSRSLWWVALTVSVAVGCAGEGEDFGEDDDDPLYGTTEAAASARWSPPTTNQPGTATSAGPWNGGRNCASGLRPGSKALGAALDAKFSAVARVDGYACRRNTANASQLSMHGTGRAIDIFVSRAGGTAVADYLASNANTLGVQLLIWNRTIWQITPGGGSSRAYGGANPHTDHIHAELTSAAASRTTSPDPGAGDAGGSSDTGGSDGPESSGWPDATSTSGGGQSCTTDGACNPGNDGSGLVCESGRCVPGCRIDAHCPGVMRCSAGQCR